jgi:hypothetical protein
MQTLIQSATVAPDSGKEIVHPLDDGASQHFEHIDKRRSLAHEQFFRLVKWRSLACASVPLLDIRTPDGNRHS